MQNKTHVLTPENLQLVKLISELGSFAAAARALNLAPSALTYRIRQIEDALDALLFDRSHRLAKPTPAGQALITESARIMHDMDALAQRVKRIATGWESELTIAVDTVIAMPVVLQISQGFLALNPSTRLKIRSEALSGTVSALQNGLADIAIGIPDEALFLGKHIQYETLGPISFVFAVAPHHPLAQIKGKISTTQIKSHRFVIVADTVATGQGISIAYTPGQDAITVPDMQSKLQAQCLGLGVGFLPEPMARPMIESGQLVECEIEQPSQRGHVRYGWRLPDASSQKPGKAMAWWLSELARQRTRQRLLGMGQH